jgi:hypothetical protein
VWSGRRDASLYADDGGGQARPAEMHVCTQTTMVSARPAETHVCAQTTMVSARSAETHICTKTTMMPGDSRDPLE